MGKRYKEYSQVSQVPDFIPTRVRVKGRKRTETVIAMIPNPNAILPSDPNRPVQEHLNDIRRMRPQRG